MRSVVWTLGLVLLLANCRSNVLERRTVLLMDTYVTVQACGPRAAAKQAIQAALKRLEEIDQRFSAHDSLSPVYRFNCEERPLEDSEVVALVQAAVEVSEATGGAFDVTVEPLVRLWGFYGEHPAVPGQSVIDSVMKHVGSRNLVFENGRVRKLDPNARIDLGGIAKGYALAQAAQAMRHAGVDSGLIDAGGDVYAFGRRAGRAWRVGVRSPRGDSMVGVLEVRNLAVVTSGDYERFFVSGESRYCHIIDPRTGWPAQGVASVTAVARDPALADAWATAGFVLGPDVVELAARHGVEMLVLTDRMERFASSGFDRLDVRHPESDTGPRGARRTRKTGCPG